MGKRSVEVKRGPSGKRGEAWERILQAANEAFTELDYKHATFREIARRADVDPALIAYYFGSKAELLREAMALPSDPKELMAAALLDGPPEETGHRVAATILNTWEQAATAGTIESLFNLLLQDSTTQQTFAKYVEGEIMDSIRQAVGTDLDLAVQLMMSGILGVLLSRYVVKIEPLASMSREDLIEVLGTIIQRLLGQLETV